MDEMYGAFARRQAAPGLSNHQFVKRQVDNENMDRVVISKRVLDRLIRAKLEMLEECAGVTALPVVVSARTGGRGCNWTIPGWTGDQAYVNHCNRKMRGYLEFLRGQFNVSDA